MVSSDYAGWESGKFEMNFHRFEGGCEGCWVNYLTNKTINVRLIHGLSLMSFPRNFHVFMFASDLLLFWLPKFFVGPPPPPSHRGRLLIPFWTAGPSPDLFVTRKWQTRRRPAPSVEAAACSNHRRGPTERKPITWHTTFYVVCVCVCALVPLYACNAPFSGHL